jgi:preprotein translocase subunit SecD
MFGQDFIRSGIAALVFALVVSLAIVFIVFAILGWIARRRGL